MDTLDRLIPSPRLVERDEVDLASDPAHVWSIARHLDLASLPIARALFATRTAHGRARERRGGDGAPLDLRIDALRSTPDQPGFQILLEEPRELAVGAIGKVWHLDIPFVHVANAGEFARFAEPDQVKVAWALAVRPLGEHDARAHLEVRVDATDDAAWRKFRAYFAVIGPASRWIRHALLRELARELGTPEELEDTRPLPGDELLPDAAGQITHGITIRATPEQIWPWLLQMGCHRAGYYSYDLLDNGNEPSAREIHPELVHVRVGDVLPASPRSADGFEVLRIDAPRALVLGGLFDVEGSAQRRFAEIRPERYWHVTWAFSLERLDARSTRVHVRARAAHSPDQRTHLFTIRPVHALMERAQLRHLAARAEGRLPRDGAREVLAGIGGAARMIGALATPFRRDARAHWGLDAEDAERVHLGDELVPRPRWTWTHAVEIDAPASDVWPWVAQIGAGRAGFYSYQWLENVVGCGVRNAETIHPEWAAREGDPLYLHPKMPPLRVVRVDEGRAMLAFGAPDESARAAGKPWIAATWLFEVEPLGSLGCRFVSRYRADSSDDLATRLAFGPTLVEPIGFTMDLRMLLGVKERVVRARQEVLARAG